MHLDTLYSVALRLTGNGFDAENLLQDAVKKAYRGCDRLREGTNRRAWLVTILLDTFIDRLRREIRCPNPVDYDEVGDASVFESVRGQNPEGSFFRSIVDDEVERAIQELPEDSRNPVVLRDLEGMSYAEMAEVMKLPVGTVKSRLFGGRRRLQRRLYGYAVEMGCLR